MILYKGTKVHIDSFNMPQVIISKEIEVLIIIPAHGNKDGEIISQYRYYHEATNTNYMLWINWTRQ